MTRTLILALTSAALLTASAQAADLGWSGGNASPVNMYTPSSAFQWSGFYAGVNGGYGFGNVSREPVGGGPVTNNNTGGWELGGQAGYNMDMGGFVIGAEADLQWSNIGYEAVIGANTAKASIDGFGTVRARAGIAFDRVMPYVTGGVAYGRGTVSSTTGAGVVTSQSNTHLGWAVGAGLEAAATDNITLKAEYLYVDLGSQPYTTAPGGNSDVGQRFGVIRAGINYKF